MEELPLIISSARLLVLDVETTGWSPQVEAITEIAAVRLEGANRFVVMDTLVDPGFSIPASITSLTGISDATVRGAPRISEVLDTLLNLASSSVIVGHNVGFDLGFINMALQRNGRPALGRPWVDTAALARATVRHKVPNCRLSTLASSLALANRPSHRALADALTTADLLEHLVSLMDTS